jgi:GNAT superfamily N-acetyltransferase
MSILDLFLDVREGFEETKHPRGFDGKFARKMGALAKAHPKVKIDATAREAGIVLSRIHTPEEHRGKGHAGKALKDLLAFADTHGKAVALTPEAMGKGGLSKSALTAWYKSHGFVPNKGRAKDYAFRESMIRPAKPKAKR